MSRVTMDCTAKRTLRIPSDPSKLPQVRRFIERFMRQCLFDPDSIGEVKVAVGEACANAMEHGSPEGKKNKISVVCQCADGSFMVEVVDEGRFKRTLRPENGRHGPRGRGIFLMLALMDKVVIDEGEDGTTVRLYRKHPPLHQSAKEGPSLPEKKTGSA